MVLGGAVLGLTVALAVLAGRVGDLRDQNAHLERQAAIAEQYAEERLEVMAERLFTLTARWNDQADLLDVFAEACKADGWCVEASDE